MAGAARGPDNGAHGCGTRRGGRVRERGNYCVTATLSGALRTDAGETCQLWTGNTDVPDSPTARALLPPARRMRPARAPATLRTQRRRMAVRGERCVTAQQHVRPMRTRPSAATAPVDRWFLTGNMNHPPGKGAPGRPDGIPGTLGEPEEHITLATYGSDKRATISEGLEFDADTRH